MTIPISWRIESRQISFSNRTRKLISATFNKIQQFISKLEKQLSTSDKSEFYDRRADLSDVVWKTTFKS